MVHGVNSVFLRDEDVQRTYPNGVVVGKSGCIGLPSCRWADLWLIDRYP